MPAPGSRSASAVACSCAPASRRLSSRLGHAVRVVEGDVGGGALGQRGGLLLRARLPQAVQQRPRRPGRRGRRGRRIAVQPARWPAPARPPPAGCPAARPRRAGSSREAWAADRGSASAVTCSCAPASRSLPSSPATAAGSSRETWAADRGRQRGGLLLRARLPQPVQQRPRRPGRRGGRGRRRGSASAVACSCAPASRSLSSSAGHGVRVVEGDVGGGAVGQRGDLLLRARRPQAVQQPGHGPAGSSRETWAAGAVGQRGGLLLRARLPQRCPAAWPRRPGRRGRRGRRDHGAAARRPAPARPPPAACPAAGHGGRVVEGDVGGGALGQRGGLLLRARLPQAVQQPATAPGRRGRRGRRRGAASAVTCSCAPASCRLSSSLATAPGSSRETWAAGSRRSSAVTCSCAPASRSLSSSHGHGVRVVEGDVGDGPAQGADVSAEVVRRCWLR